MNLSNLTQFQSMTPTEIVSQLQEEMKHPLFRKVAVATFSDTKYFLKPEAFSLHLSKKLPNPESVGPLTMEWAGWTVLDAMASGTLSGNAAKFRLLVLQAPVACCLPSREVDALALQDAGGMLF